MRQRQGHQERRLRVRRAASAGSTDGDPRDIFLPLFPPSSRRRHADHDGICRPSRAHARQSRGATLPWELERRNERHRLRSAGTPASTSEHFTACEMAMNLRDPRSILDAARIVVQRSRAESPRAARRAQSAPASRSRARAHRAHERHPAATCGSAHGPVSPNADPNPLRIRDCRRRESRRMCTFRQWRLRPRQR